MTKKIYSLLLSVFLLSGCNTLHTMLEIPPENYERFRHNPHIDCSKKGYHCKTIHEGDTWASLFPDIERRHFIMALNRTNYRLDHYKKVLIPNNFDSKELLSHAPVPIQSSKKYKHVLVSIEKSIFASYDDTGEITHWGPISAGSDCNTNPEDCSTRRGEFTVYRKKGEECVSSKYPEPVGGGTMPFCMFFDGGVALHGASLPGYHASHGCVRLLKKDARWLYENFVRIGTPVVVEL